MLCPVTADELRELYEVMPSDQLADHLNRTYGLDVTKHWVLRQLKAAGIPRRKYSPYQEKRIECPFTADRLQELYWRDGLCCREIAEQAAPILNLKRIMDATVQRWLREAGVKLRTPHEWLILRARKDPERWAEHAKKHLKGKGHRDGKGADRRTILKAVRASAKSKHEAAQETRHCARCGKPVTRMKCRFRQPPEFTYCDHSCANRDQKDARERKRRAQLAREIVAEAMAPEE